MIQIELQNRGFFYLPLEQPPAEIRDDFLDGLDIFKEKDLTIDTYLYWYHEPTLTWYREGYWAGQVFEGTIS